MPEINTQPVHIKSGDNYSGYNFSNATGINQLPSATSISDTDIMLLHNGTDAKKITTKQLQEYATVHTARDVFVVTTPAFNSLPRTFSAPGITADHRLLTNGQAYVSNPASQGGEWTINTAQDSITISGTFSGTSATYVEMTLGIIDAITAT